MPIQRILTRDIVYQAIREAVVSGELSPGTRVTETMLASKFEMSRTPLREAIQRLDNEGLVIRQSNGTLMVSPLDYDILEEIFDIRERLEGIIAAHAARLKDKTLTNQLTTIVRNESVKELGQSGASMIRMYDQQFHEQLWEASKKQLTVSILFGFKGLFERYQRLAPPCENMEARLKTIVAEHKLIIQSIQEGDSVWAEMAVKAHIRQSRQFLLNAYKQVRKE